MIVVVFFLCRNLLSLHIFFVCCDVNDDVSELFLTLISKYMKVELKGQCASKKCLKSGILQQDFPYSKLRCLRGLLTEKEQCINKKKSQCLKWKPSLFISKKCVPCRPTSQLIPIATHGKRHVSGNEYVRNQYFYRS